MTDIPPQLPEFERSGKKAPPIITGPSQNKSSLRGVVAHLLSLFLLLFIVDAIVSVADDSLILLFDLHILSVFRSMVFFAVFLGAILVYLLMGLTPIVPKRWFLPVTLFIPFCSLLALPLLIYFPGKVHEIAIGISVFQFLVGSTVLYFLRRRSHARWPVLAEGMLSVPTVTWRNLTQFAAINLFVFLPAALFCLALSAASAVDHFSKGFVGLRPTGLTMQARTYVRDDGKTIQLYPMAHIGDAGFYSNLSRSFPSNSIVLMEGVMDRNNLLTNKTSYKRMAKSLGLADQQKEFNPDQGKVVMADMDVEAFSAETISMINLIMLVHAKGVTPETFAMLMQYAPTPGAEERLFDDILRKRNRHLLGVIDEQLQKTDIVVVPWGAAHMPEIASEIQKTGFRLKNTEDFVVVRFGRQKQPAE